MNSRDLDRWITGNYGEDQFKGQCIDVVYVVHLRWGPDNWRPYSQGRRFSQSASAYRVADRIVRRYGEQRVAVATVSRETGEPVEPIRSLYDEREATL